jgi:hypothetical protein
MAWMRFIATSGGIVGPPEGRPGAFLYPVSTVRLKVIVELLSETALLVRTAWRVAP